MAIGLGNGELFSEKAEGGGSLYFFDVKCSQTGVKYLVISESKRDGKEFERSRIIVFDQHLSQFYDSLQKAVDFLKNGST